MFGDASNNMPVFGSLKVTPNKIWPWSFITPEPGKYVGGGGKIIVPVAIWPIVPTPGITVPVRATKRSKPDDET
jgi:hypothetical protein